MKGVSSMGFKVLTFDKPQLSVCIADTVVESSDKLMDTLLYSTILRDELNSTFLSKHATVGELELTV